MCYLRCLYCCCCWQYVKTLTYNSCAQAKHCQRRTVYSKSLAICELCDIRCRKPCSSFETIPRRWTEKKHEGYFVTVGGFKLDCNGNVVVVPSNYFEFLHFSKEELGSFSMITQALRPRKCRISPKTKYEVGSLQ